MEDLLENIERTTKEHGLSFRKLSEKEAEDKLRSLKDSFKFDFCDLYLWESEQNNKKVDSYEDDWEDKLLVNLGEFEPNIYLTVTDDEYFPWKVFLGDKNDLVELLEEQRFFEYFIFDGSINKILFDTHHNCFVSFDPVGA